MCVPFAQGANATASTQIFHPPEVGLKLSVGGALFFPLACFCCFARLSIIWVVFVWNLYSLAVYKKLHGLSIKLHIFKHNLEYL
jgi:hypothetical protein